MNAQYNETNEWMEIRLLVGPALADALTEFCILHGSNGIVEAEADDLVELTAYLPCGNWDEIHQELMVFLRELHEVCPEEPLRLLKVEPLKSENWAVMWKDNFRIMDIGRRLTVCPPWLIPDPASVREVVIIDPAEAFGTGTHETTQGCLILLETAAELIEQEGGTFSVLDVGCGSGILALAALRLGASPVTALDDDQKATGSVVVNAGLNRLDGKLDIICGSIENHDQTADVTLANLDPMTLIAFRHRLVLSCRKFLIISGVPADQWENLKEKFLLNDFKMEKEMLGVEWGSALLRRTH
jgi:ribosomal protein L11 methyltransferase